MGNLLLLDAANIHDWFIDLDDDIFIFVFRILIALLCGFCIGWERMNRSKVAGIRTHAIVCMAAAIIMIVSKYGFSDQVIGEAGVRGADAARLAAQVVSGIGFLGAGVIFYRKDFLHGLTTAAGIWSTGAIGLTIGSGMVIIGIVATIILLLLQVMMHHPLKRLRTISNNILTISLKLDSPADLDRIKDVLSVEKFNSFKSSVNPDGTLNVEVELVSKNYSSESEILALVQNHKEIVSIERISD